MMKHTIIDDPFNPICNADIIDQIDGLIEKLDQNWLPSKYTQIDPPLVVDKYVTPKDQLINTICESEYDKFISSGIDECVQTLQIMITKKRNANLTKLSSDMLIFYGHWKKYFINRTYYVKTSKYIGSGSAFTMALGVATGVGTLLTGGGLGILCAGGMFAYKYSVDEKTIYAEENAFFMMCDTLVTLKQKIQNNAPAMIEIKHELTVDDFEIMLPTVPKKLTSKNTINIDNRINIDQSKCLKLLDT